MLGGSGGAVEVDAPLPVALDEALVHVRQEPGGSSVMKGGARTFPNDPVGVLALLGSI